MRFVGLEVVERLRSVRRIRAMVAVMRVVAIVDMAIKPVRPVKPGSSSDEYSAYEPIGPIETIRCTVIGSVVVVAIGADRGHPDVDGYLRRRTRKPTQHERSEKRINNNFPMTHRLLLQIPPIGSWFQPKGCARSQNYAVPGRKIVSMIRSKQKCHPGRSEVAGPAVHHPRIESRWKHRPPLCTYPSTNRPPLEAPPSPLSSRAKPRDPRFNGPVLEMFFV
jgi:hypothetical protein